MSDVKAIEMDGELVVEPMGYQLLVMIPPAKEKKGSILLPEQYTDKQTQASIVGYVVALGADAYEDREKFPNGAWCKPGDYVMFKAYSGVRFKLADSEFRLVNDDTIMAVVKDPAQIERC